MQKKELYFSGKKLVSLVQASDASGYARDYIGQLCRKGKIGCRRVGRAWFVDLDSLYLYVNRRSLSKVTHKKKIAKKVTLFNEVVRAREQRFSKKHAYIKTSNHNHREKSLVVPRNISLEREESYRKNDLEKYSAVFSKKRKSREQIFKKTSTVIVYGIFFVLIVFSFWGYFNQVDLKEEKITSELGSVYVVASVGVYNFANNLSFASIGGFGKYFKESSSIAWSVVSGGARFFENVVSGSFVITFDYANSLSGEFFDSSVLYKREKVVEVFGERSVAVNTGEFVPKVLEPAESLTFLFGGVERSFDSSWIISGFLFLVLFVLVVNNIRVRSKVYGGSGQVII